MKSVVQPLLLSHGTLMSKAGVEQRNGDIVKRAGIQPE